jgi:hypothetical protein
MKLAARVFALALATSGAIAGFVSTHSATAQTVTLGNQVVSSALPAPVCSPETCNIRGGVR